VEMWAEALPSGQRVTALFNSLQDPQNIYHFSSPTPGLSGGWYQFQQRIPSAGCWRLVAAIDHTVIGTATLDIRDGPPSPGPSTFPCPGEGPIPPSCAPS